MTDNERRFRAITERMAGVYAKKNRGYGDSFSEGFRDYGIIAAAIRLGDKYKRLKTLIQQNCEEDWEMNDSIYDTLLDMANYAVMTLMELEKHKPEIYNESNETEN